MTKALYDQLDLIDDLKDKITENEYLNMVNGLRDIHLTPSDNITEVPVPTTVHVHTGSSDFVTPCIILFIIASLLLSTTVGLSFGIYAAKMELANCTKYLNNVTK